MGIAEILAVLAFFVAMIALWLVSDVLKKIESQNEKFISTHIKVIRTDLSDFDDRLRNFTKAMKLMEDKLKSNEKYSHEQVAAMTGNIKNLEKKLSDLDQSIPQRFREKPDVRPRSIQ
ncbi:MAG: hypothetical protein KAI27_06180 [Rhodospirillaceae bacterium]|nr:hypothetical protein [Rhodospirillaceae bacterium]